MVCISILKIKIINILVIKWKSYVPKLEFLPLLWFLVFDYERLQIISLIENVLENVLLIFYKLSILVLSPILSLWYKYIHLNCILC